MRRLRSSSHDSPNKHRRVRRVAGSALVAFTLVLAAACGGSTLDPEYVQSANNPNGVSGGGTPGDVTGSGDTPAGTDPDAGDSGTGDSGGGASIPGVKAASCDGFKNQKGITDKTILLGNASDISGPVPGLFSAAQQGTKAYIAYFNATTNICGRKLELTTLDSRTDAGADQQAYTKLCETVFAAVGSMSAFDSGGAGTAEKCGLPDIRTAAVTATRNACSTCFGAQATGAREFSNAIPDFFVKHYKAASQKAAFLYLNAGASAENAVTQQKIETRRGMKFVYSSGIDVAEFNYGPYVQQMKSKGVRWVQFIGGYQQGVRLAQAMQSANFKPDVMFFDPTVYDAGFVRSGGSAVEGAITFTNFTPFEESQPEINLYKRWLQQVAPGAAPTFFGLFAWSATKLFVAESLSLGGKLTRSSLVANVRGVRAWKADGAHGPMDVGGKHSPSCVRFLQLRGGKWVPLKGTAYVCHGA
ncbi:ABC transporter substrate-binding protein, partial [Aeromicrobium sp.]|uniref:ABC transporter substrate-binding protein n=1 Tax=Aeromicrobium sp. TaxID=1871063 RepID=UPI002FC91781